MRSHVSVQHLVDDETSSICVCELKLIPFVCEALWLFSLKFGFLIDFLFSLFNRFTRFSIFHGLLSLLVREHRHCKSRDHFVSSESSALNSIKKRHWPEANNYLIYTFTIVISIVRTEFIRFKVMCFQLFQPLVWMVVGRYHNVCICIHLFYWSFFFNKTLKIISIISSSKNGRSSLKRERNMHGKVIYIVCSNKHLLHVIRIQRILLGFSIYTHNKILPSR